LFALRPVSKPSLRQYNRGDYDVLRTHLFGNLGPYCSYCESPLANDSAVEHKVPKNNVTGFDGYATQWRNLLLCCKSCNSAKGTKPSKQDIADPGSRDYLNTLNLWVWPDKTAQMRDQDPPPVDESYKLFTFEYSAKTQVQLRDLGLVRLKPGDASQPWATTAQTMLWIKQNDANTTDAALRKRVLDTIQGLNLNYYDTSNEGYNDRRVDNRKKAMESANQALANLERAARAAGNVLLSNPNVMMMMQAIRQTVIATGFWSVWFWIFRQALDNPPAASYWHQFPVGQRKALLEALLIYYTSPAERASATDLIFLGTDYQRLDMAAFS
jgi:hypothetical protein